MFIETINPRFNETDAFGHINNNVYTIWFDHCRQPFLKFFDPNLEPNNMPLILAHTSTDFLKEVFYGKDIIIRTALEKIGNSSMHFTHGLYQNDELCTIGKAIMIHFKHKTKQSIPIPQNIKDELEKHLIKENWPNSLIF